MRSDWPAYFLDIARVVASRSTCPRKSVGCVIVRDRNALCMGFNGSARGLPHCCDEGVGCDMEDGHCVRTTHAEVNALLQAAKNGTAVDGADCYVTASPCWPCYRALVNAGIRRIFFSEEYRPDPRIEEAAELTGVRLERVG